MQFSESSQNSISENSFFGHFEVDFSTYNFFPGRGWYFPVSTSKAEYFDEKMNSLAGLKKNYSISRKITDVGHFWLPRSTFKVDFLNKGEEFQKILGTFVRGRLLETLC